MCIRDREYTTAIDDITVEPGPFVSISINTGVDADLLTYITCLLYTSDAADERSSVDLGGRRIIKKKQTITTRAD